MSSIPLPRILQTKKANGEFEKEQFDKQMVNIKISFCLQLIFLYVFVQINQ